MRAIWLTDIFDSALGSKNSKSAVSLPAVALRALGWTKADQTTIAYLAHHGEQYLFLAYDVPKAQRFSVYPQKLLQKHVAKLDTRSLKTTARLLTENSASLKSGVEKVIEFAQRDRTDLIALQTHSRDGFQRFILGSFAETMMLLSPVSLHILNPDANVSLKTQRILLATDIDKNSDALVKQAARFAKKSGASLRILHIALPSFSTNFSGQDADVAKYRKQVNRRIAELVAISESQGVETDAIIRDDLMPKSDLILKEIKSSKSDVVAVQSKSGPLKRMLLGSVARNIVRAAKVPVLVLR